MSSIHHRLAVFFLSPNLVSEQKSSSVRREDLANLGMFYFVHVHVGPVFYRSNRDLCISLVDSHLHRVIRPISLPCTF